MTTIQDTRATYLVDRDTAKTAKTAETAPNGHRHPHQRHRPALGRALQLGQRPTHFEVTIDDLSATASCRSDLAGLVGVPGADPRLQGLTLRTSVTSPSPAEDVAALERARCERCPVLLALQEPVPVERTVQRA